MNPFRKIGKIELEKTDEVLSREKPITDTQTRYGNSYYYGSSEDSSVSRESLMRKIEGTEIKELYVHVPFCERRCLYCTYSLVTGQDEATRERYVDEFSSEAEDVANRFNFEGLRTVHVGGGTPNRLTNPQLDKFLGIINSNFDGESLVEKAIEITPSEANEGTLQIIRRNGFNRVSIGIQTFNQEINELNGRLNQDSNDVRTLVRSARELYPNVSVDLLAGQRGQTQRILEDDYKSALDLDPNSIYLYQIRQGFKNRGVEEIEALNEFLSFFTQHGYEIVSHNQVIKKRNSDGYCEQRDGRAKLENLLGLGPSANSEIEGFAFTNLTPSKYLKFGRGIDEETIRLKTQRNQKALRLLRALRYFTDPSINGLNIESYREKFGSYPAEDFKDQLNVLRQNTLVTIDPTRIQITDKGMLFTQWIDNYLTGHYK